MHRKITCLFIVVVVILSSSYTRSSTNQLEEKWNVVFDRYYKGNRIQGIEGFGIDEKQNILLQINCGSNIFYSKYDINGNEVVSVLKPSDDFSSDPIMDEEGNVYTYMPWAENEYNFTYFKFDSNMTLVSKIKINSSLAHQCDISNQGNIYLAVDKLILIEDVEHLETKIFSFNQTGYLDWDLSFVTKITMNRTRSSPFLDWKFIENRKGDLYLGFTDNLVKINTSSKSVVWKRKLSLEIHTITVYEQGVSVICADYVKGPVICSQISHDNTLLSNFTMDTKSMFDYYYRFHFNSKYYLMKTTNRRETGVCKLKIFSENGILHYEEKYPLDSNILYLYGLKNLLTDFYVFETHYNSTTDVAKYILKLKSFKNVVPYETFTLSQDIWLLLVIEIAFILLIRKIKKTNRFSPKKYK